MKRGQLIDTADRVGDGVDWWSLKMITKELERVRTSLTINSEHKEFVRLFLL